MGYKSNPNLSKNKSQPVTIPSAGCAFKNPSAESAGRLLDTAGVKGLQVGGAVVSEKHANFIVNTGDATASDVVSLLEKMHEAVMAKHQIDLQRELIVWG